MRSMPSEGDQTADRDAEGFDLGRAAEVGKVDDETRRGDLGDHLRQSLIAPSAVPPVAIRSSTRITRSPLDTASSCISM